MTKNQLIKCALIYDALLKHKGVKSLVCNELDMNPRVLNYYLEKIPQLKQLVKPKKKLGNKKWERFKDV